VWATGDVIGKSMLAHSEYLMGRVCTESIEKVPTQTKIDYVMIPRAVFTDPNITSFGYTEKQLQARKIPYKRDLPSLDIMEKPLLLIKRKVGFLF